MESSIVIPEFVDADVGPRGSLEHLSQAEIAKLLDRSKGGLYPLFRKCALAVLNSGADTDNAKEIFDRYDNFDIKVVRHAWGIRLEIHNAPASQNRCFVIFSPLHKFENESAALLPSSNGEAM